MNHPGDIYYHPHHFDVQLSYCQHPPDPFYIRTVGQVGHMDNGRKSLDKVDNGWAKDSDWPIMISMTQE